MADITISANDIASAITKGLEGFSPSLEQQTVGHVAEVGDGIARVSGLPKSPSTSCSSSRTAPSVLH